MFARLYQHIRLQPAQRIAKRFIALLLASWAGYSADDSGHSGANLTDSIMIVSIRQSDHTADVISIPRDLIADSLPGPLAYYPRSKASYYNSQFEQYLPGAKKFITARKLLMIL